MVFMSQVLLLFPLGSPLESSASSHLIAIFSDLCETLDICGPRQIDQIDHENAIWWRETAGKHIYDDTCEKNIQ